MDVSYVGPQYRVEVVVIREDRNCQRRVVSVEVHDIEKLTESGQGDLLRACYKAAFDKASSNLRESR